MFIYVLLMKLLIIGAFSGEVSRRFREGFGEVSGRFREGFGEVPRMFFSGRFREGFGEVPPCPAIENVKKEVSFFRNLIAKTSLKATCSDLLFQRHSHSV